jgi:hypothetical protein
MDFDEDGDVDQVDFGRMQACLTGAGALQMDPLCDRTPLDNDDDTDADDLGIFRDCMSGPGLEPEPACGCPTP